MDYFCLKCLLRIYFGLPLAHAPLRSPGRSVQILIIPKHSSRIYFKPPAHGLDAELQTVRGRLPGTSATWYELFNKILTHGYNTYLGVFCIRLREWYG